MVRLILLSRSTSEMGCRCISTPRAPYHSVLVTSLVQFKLLASAQQTVGLKPTRAICWLLCKGAHPCNLVAARVRMRSWSTTMAVTAAAPLRRLVAALVLRLESLTPWALTAVARTRLSAAAQSPRLARLMFSAQIALPLPPSTATAHQMLVPFFLLQ